MYCKTCGNQIDLDSVFCSFCGTKQSEINKPNSTNFERFEYTETKPLNVNLSFGRQNQQMSGKEEKIYKQSKYDTDYEKDTDSIFLGALILLISIGIAFVGNSQFDNSDSLNQFRSFTYIGSLIIRILAVVLVTKVANRQNRETFGWGVFAFFLPSLALIIIGLQKKIFLKVEVDESKSNEENSQLLCEKSIYLLNDKKYNESIRFAEAAIKLDTNNKLAKDTLTNIRLEIPFDQIFNRTEQIVCRKTKDDKILTIISKNYQTIGAKVFIEDKVAPDGEYEYLKDNRKVIVKDGKIENVIS